MRSRPARGVRTVLDEFHSFCHPERSEGSAPFWQHAMTSPLSSLARAAIGALPRYQTDDGFRIDLSDNTNLWGPPPAALRLMQAAPAQLLSRYPTTYSDALSAPLLRYCGIGQQPGLDVVVGCGSDDILDSTMRAFGAPGDSIAYSTPTFTMIPVYAQLNGLSLSPIPFADDFDVDAERLVDCRAKITYLCAPNNPTGTRASRAAVEYVVSNAQGIVLMDEAYAEFASETFVDLLSRNERLVIARTFSKAFGLAGLRIGYGLGARDTIEPIARARGPYKVTALAEQAAAAALSETDDGVEWVQRHAREAVAVREWLTGALRALGLTVLPSDANFVLVLTSNATHLAHELRKHGVLVRLLRGLPSQPRALAECGGSALRIGVGPWETMQALLSALEEVLSCG